MSPRLDRVGTLTVHVHFADHRRPHIQVRGAGVRANVDIATGAVLAGKLSVRDRRMVRDWLMPRRSALTEAFEAALRHEEPDAILATYREATHDL